MCGEQCVVLLTHRVALRLQVFYNCFSGGSTLGLVVHHQEFHR